jgi:hypothetical protein
VRRLAHGIEQRGRHRRLRGRRARRFVLGAVRAEDTSRWMALGAHHDNGFAAHRHARRRRGAGLFRNRLRSGWGWRSRTLKDVCSLLVNFHLRPSCCRVSRAEPSIPSRIRHTSANRRRAEPGQFRILESPGSLRTTLRWRLLELTFTRCVITTPPAPRTESRLSHSACPRSSFRVACKSDPP